MSRVHYFFYLTNERGDAVSDADISIYLAQSTTSAVIYTQEVGGTALETAPQLTTNAQGFFEFWIADADESGGYAYSQKFKLKWEKAGASDGEIDNINVFSPSSGKEIDITDTSTTKNKFISNYLGKGWEDHKDSTLSSGTSASAISPHGINLQNIYYHNIDLDIDTADSPKVIDSFSKTDYDGCIWHYTVKQTDPTITVRTGTIQACWDPISGNLEQALTETNNVGVNGADITITAAISSNSVVLRATVTSNNWSIKLKRLTI